MKKIIYLLTLSFFLMAVLISCGSKEGDKPKEGELNKEAVKTTDTVTAKEEPKSGKPSPMEYNDRLIGIQNSVIKEFLELAKTLSSNDKAAIAAAYTKALEITNTAVEAVKKEGPFDGDDNFRLKLQALLEFYKSIVENEYKEMIKILSKGSKIKPKDMDKLTKIQASISERENKLDAEMSAAQSAFAVKNGIQLETNKFQKDIDSIGK